MSIILAMIPGIKSTDLDGYKKTAWSKDHFAETTDGKYGLIFYNVNEHSMGAYYGHLSIFRNNSLVISSGKIWISYQYKETFVYAKSSDCIIVRMAVYQQKIDKSNYPFILIKPGSKEFSFIDFEEFISIYYSFEEIDNNVIKVTESSPRELDRINYPRRTGEIINLDELVWHNLSQFENADKIYLMR